MTKNQNMNVGESFETHINWLPERYLPRWGFVEGWELSDYSREPKSQIAYELHVDATRNGAGGVSNVLHNHYFTTLEAATRAEQEHQDTPFICWENGVRHEMGRKETNEENND
jgi:hypothetical protein